MLKHVLREARAVLELTEQTDDVGMNAVNAGVEGGLFAHFADLHFEFLLALMNHVLDAGGMDAAVLDEAFKSHAGHLTADGAVGGKNHGFRRVVDDEITPVAASSARMLRPSRPMMRPFMSSLGRVTAVTVCSPT